MLSSGKTEFAGRRGGRERVLRVAPTEQISNLPWCPSGLQPKAGRWSQVCAGRLREAARDLRSAPCNGSESRRAFDAVRRTFIAALMVVGVAAAWPRAQGVVTPRFPLTQSGLSLQRGLTSGAFFDVVGRRSAAFGYEGRPVEVWVHPIKVFDNCSSASALDGYPLAVPAAELPGTIEVRPEATIITWSHAAFTVRAIVFAPIDEGAIVIMLGYRHALPLTVLGSFRPALRPMWPAGAPTANAGWDRSCARL